MAEKGKNTPTGGKKINAAEIALVAAVVLLVGILLLMERRTVSVTLPASPDDVSVWSEAGNDGSVVLKSDEGFVSETEYGFKYRSVSRNGSTVIVFLCTDPDTGDEMAERIAYRFSTDALGFARAERIDVPEDFRRPDTATSDDPLPDEPGEDAAL